METEENQERIYINVPFEEKEQAKLIGAKWDKEKKSWYVLAGTDKALFEQWLKELEKAPVITTSYICQKCGSPLLQRKAKSGTLWFSCSTFPMCEVRYWANNENSPKFDS